MIIRHNTQLNSYNYAVLMMVQGLLRNTDIKTTLSAALIHCIKTVIEDKDILASSPTFRYQDNSEPVHKIHNTKLLIPKPIIEIKINSEYSLNTSGF